MSAGDHQSSHLQDKAESIDVDSLGPQHPRDSQTRIYTIPERRREEIRGILAIMLVVLLLLTIVAVTWLLAVDRLNDTSASMIIGAVTPLTATVLGFYFGSSR